MPHTHLTPGLASFVQYLPATGTARSRRTHRPAFPAHPITHGSGAGRGRRPWIGCSRGHINPSWSHLVEAWVSHSPPCSPLPQSQNPSTVFVATMPKLSLEDTHMARVRVGPHLFVWTNLAV